MTDTDTTAHIPDEAVQAARVAMASKDISFYHLDAGHQSRTIAYVLTAALPHLSAPCAVEVVKLKWVDDVAETESLDLRYLVELSEEETNVAWYVLEEQSNSEISGANWNKEQAKAAAQADFERRILSCLVTKPVDVAAVRGCAATVAINALQWIVDHPKESNAVVWDLAIDALAAIRALSSEQAQGEQNGITISTLQSAHIERQKEWCPDQQPDLSFRGNEMAGEVGEACNVIKKLERERQGWRGSRSSKEELASELADVIHTAILCAVTAGIDLEAATVEKFNATSVKNGLQTLLPAAPTPEAGK